MKKRVINFSGGATSALMTIREYRDGDIVLFTDTGREDMLTYVFIDEFEKYEGIPVTRISRNNSDRAFSDYLKEIEYRRLPNRMMRDCTRELKVRTAKRYLKSIGVLQYENMIGFRADEEVRVKRHVEKYVKVTTTFPLYRDGVTKSDVDAFWSEKPYRLKVSRILGNCTLCFLKGKNAIIRILNEHPELASPWIADEDKSAEKFGHTYFKGTTIRELLAIAQSIPKGASWLEGIEPSYNCACGP